MMKKFILFLGIIFCASFASVLDNTELYTIKANNHIGLIDKQERVADYIKLIISNQLVDTDLLGEVFDSYSVIYRELPQDIANIIQSILKGLGYDVIVLQDMSSSLSESILCMVVYAENKDSLKQAVAYLIDTKQAKKENANEEQESTQQQGLM